MPEETEPTTTETPLAPMSGPDSWPEEARRKVAELNAENASWRTKFREAEPWMAKAKELEEAQKSAEQRATEAQAAAEKRATDAEAELLRLKVAAEKGLTAAQAKRLVGATREELLADADDYLASLPSAPPAPASTARTPVEALRPAALPAQPDPTIDDRIAEAESKGDIRTAIALKTRKLTAIQNQ